jgi:hypothetical protein
MWNPDHAARWSECASNDRDTLGDQFTFQQDSNLKHKAKSTLELLTKKTVNVSEWPSYSFDLDLLEN